MEDYAKIRYIWHEKTIDFITDYYDFGSHFRNDVDATFLTAELSPPIEGARFFHFNDFSLKRSKLYFYNPNSIEFNLQDDDCITITIIEPRKVFILCIGSLIYF